MKYDYDSLMVIFFVILGTSILLWWFAYGDSNKKDIMKENNISLANLPKKEFFKLGNDFYIYNHYQIPVDIKTFDINTNEIKNVVLGIKPDEKIGVQFNDVVKYFRRGNKILIYGTPQSKDPSKNKYTLISESLFILPEDKTIKSLHIGQSSSHEDLSMMGETTRSTLGYMALPRVRIVNLTSRKLKLISGSKQFCIKPHLSIIYLGDNEQGIQLGSVLRDTEGILKDFVIDMPMTDIHLGITSDLPIPHYTGSRFGDDLDDTVSVANYPLQLHGMGGKHIGSTADRSYIP